MCWLSPLMRLLTQNKVVTSMLLHQVFVICGSITAGTQEDLIVNVGDRVFFEFDSSELTVDAQSTLDAQAAWLQQYPDTNITIGSRRRKILESTT